MQNLTAFFISVLMEGIRFRFVVIFMNMKNYEYEKSEKSLASATLPRQNVSPPPARCRLPLSSSTIIVFRKRNAKVKRLRSVSGREKCIPKVHKSRVIPFEK